MEKTEKLEQPKETCGLMVTLEGGIGVTINLKTTRQRVIEKIQHHLSKGLTNLVELETANLDEEEVCLLNPNKILIALIKKEFIIGQSRILKPQLGSVNPNDLRH
ncbi:hypothetical protein LCGC14_1184600 [marine sediment metagenome]|uniref:Uncharacterized protein n=1 Tax=marine sediment metagenome TaxID=412755 RepID=A0A0F9LLA8_9ZZZZ